MTDEKQHIERRAWTEHLKEDEEFQRKTLDFEKKIVHVLFGNEATKEIGMKDKVDEIHMLLVQAKAVGGFFGGIKSLAGWLLLIGAIIALAKGWLAGIITWATFK